MAVSDDKQNRLSTLSQDVIAVPKKPSAPATAQAPSVRAGDSTQRPAERPADRKPIPATQDVFRVATTEDAPPPPAYVPPPPAYSPPAYSPPPAPAPQSQPIRAAARAAPGAQQIAAPQTLQIVTAALAGAALVLAIVGVLKDGGGGTAAGDPDAMAKMSEQLASANERVAKLELALSSAAADSEKMGAPGQANILQISAGMRQLRNDVDAVSNSLDKVNADIADVRSQAAGGNAQAKQAMAQVEQIASRMATLHEQVANMPRGGGGSGGGASADVQAQVKSLSAKTDKMAADIRQLFRLAGGQ